MDKFYILQQLYTHRIKIEYTINNCEDDQEQEKINIYRWSIEHPYIQFLANKFDFFNMTAFREKHVTIYIVIIKKIREW